MSVLDVEQIDAVGIEDATRDVVLTLTDHLDWTDEVTHLAALQDKLNTYVRFVESGEIYSAYPAAKGLNIRVEVVAKFEQPAEAQTFMCRAREVLLGIGLGLSFRIFRPRRRGHA